MLVSEGTDMGTLRKMGAFLGLVPDDQRYGADAEGDEQAYQASDYDYTEAGDSYAEAGVGSSRAGQYGVDSYGADPAADSYGTGYAADVRTDDYRADDFRSDDGRGGDNTPEYAADPQGGDYRTETYRADQYRTDSYGADQHGGNDGYRTEYPAADLGDNSRPAVAEPAYAVAPAAPTAQSGKKSRAGSRGGSRGRQDDNDFHTQGALAVQPQQFQPEAAIDMSTGKPATVKLTGFGDARQVGESYRDGQAVILDMTDLTDTEARRMVDFAAGLAFAVHGSIDKVTTKVFMLHQPNGDQAN